MALKYYHGISIMGVKRDNYPDDYDEDPADAIGALGVDVSDIADGQLISLGGKQDVRQALRELKKQVQTNPEILRDGWEMEVPMYEFSGSTISFWIHTEE